MLLTLGYRDLQQTAVAKV